MEKSGILISVGIVQTQNISAPSLSHCLNRLDLIRKVLCVHKRVCVRVCACVFECA